ncbi:hypothetical protein [Pontibacter russatus]|uniref:hypothetical protein n=1 Tax=Pontibacter russatus TaxID=2694929 RepID=UPI0013795F0F|nr:hypothetical protein [Pontibacter russatus]
MKTILPLFKGLGLLCAFLLLFSGSLLAQTTVTIGPGANWADAMLYKSYQNLSLENTNLHTQNRNLASAWSSGGQNTFFRTLFRFDLSSIPSGAVIQSATLRLISRGKGPWSLSG